MKTVPQNQPGANKGLWFLWWLESNPKEGSRPCPCWLCCPDAQLSVLTGGSSSWPCPAESPSRGCGWGSAARWDRGESWLGGTAGLTRIPVTGNHTQKTPHYFCNSLCLKLQTAATQEKTKSSLLGVKLRRSWVALWGSGTWKLIPMWVRLDAVCSHQGAGHLVDQTRFLWCPPQQLWWIFFSYEVYLLPLSIFLFSSLLKV